MFQQDYTFQSVRSAAILTGAYVASNITPFATPTLDQYNQLNLLVNLTLGSLTSVTLKIEFSNDGTNWYQEVVDAVDTSTGIISERLATRSLTASGKYYISVHLSAHYARVSAIGVGTVTGSSLTIDSAVALSL